MARLNETKEEEKKVEQTPPVEETQTQNPPVEETQEQTPPTDNGGNAGTLKLTGDFLTDWNAVQQQNDANTAKTVEGITSAGNARKESLKTTYEQQETALKDANTTMDNAASAYRAMVDGWVEAAEKEQEAQRKANEAEAKRINKVMTWGGIAESAAAIANLIGTIHGASNQKWESPQPKWQERADKLRKERDEKLQKLKDQQKALDQQRAQLMFALAGDKYKRDAALANLTGQHGEALGKVDYDTAVAATGAQNQGDRTGTTLAAQGINTYYGMNNQDKARTIAQSQYITTWRAKGYDPVTGKYRDPNTGEFTLNAPHSGKGNLTTLFGSGGNGSLSSEQTAALIGIRDNLAHAVGYENYNDLLAGKDATKRGLIRVSDDAVNEHGRWRKYEDATDNPEYKEVFLVLDKLDDIDKLTPAEVQKLMQYTAFNKAAYGEYPAPGTAVITDEGGSATAAEQKADKEEYSETEDDKNNREIVKRNGGVQLP